MGGEDEAILKVACSVCLSKWSAITFKRYMRHYRVCRRKRIGMLDDHDKANKMVGHTMSSNL